MKFFNLQVPKPGGEEPDDILRLTDADRGGTGFLAQPGGKLEGGEEPGGQLSKGAVRNAKESGCQLERGLGARPGPQDNGKQLGRGQRPSAKGPEAFPRAITIGEGGKRSRHPRN